MTLAFDSKRIVVSVLISFSTLMLISCSHPLADELNDNKEKWSNFNCRDYQYDLEPVYFGPVIYEYEYPLTVIVQSKRVFSIKDATGRELENQHKDDLKEFSTIDDIFLFLDHVVKSKPDKIAIQYDSVYGIPVFIDIYYHEGLTDDGVKLTITNFKAIQ